MVSLVTATIQTRIVLHLILQFIIGPLLWYPWFKRLDKETYEQEQLLESAGK